MDPTRDVEAIRAVESAYDAAWNAGDVDSLLACFTEDAVLVNPRGQVASGVDEVRDRLEDFLLGEARGSRHTTRIVRISFVRDDVAVVDGDARLVGVRGSDELGHRFTDVVVRRGGRWLLAHIRAYSLVGDSGSAAAQVGAAPDEPSP